MDAGEEDQSPSEKAASARGKQLAKARKDLGKRQEDIAAECDVRQPTVSAWESGSLPDTAKIRVVAAAYGVSPLLFLPVALPSPVQKEPEPAKRATRKRAGA